MRRKLVSFTSPNNWEEKGTYHISYAYYTKEGKFTGKSEDVKLSEEELYNILQPHLIINHR